jgi:hypothetical protein
MRGLNITWIEIQHNCMIEGENYAWGTQMQQRGLKRGD